MSEAFEGSWIEKHLTKLLSALLLVAVVVGVLVLSLYRWKFGASPLSGNPTRWAEFGDYLGGVLNSAFGLLAFIALLLTLRVQSVELKMSTEELRNSANALAKQNAALAKRNVEENVFQLIRLHNDIVSSLDLRRKGEVIAEGRDCFPIFYTRLCAAFDPLIRGDYLTREEGFPACYQKFFEQNEQNLGHYFRNLYRVYKYIHENGGAQKRNYSGILRAQLSSNELALLFYNGVSQYGTKFKPLLEEYEVFENINVARLFGSPIGLDLYDRRAYGDQQAALFQ